MLSWKTHKDSDSPFGWRTTNLLIIGNLVDVSAPSLWKPPRSRVGWRQRPRWLRPRLGPSLLGVLPGLLSVVGFCQRSLAEVKKSSILSLLHFFFLIRKGCWILSSAVFPSVWDSHVFSIRRLSVPFNFLKKPFAHSTSTHPRLRAPLKPWLCSCVTACVFPRVWFLLHSVPVSFPLWGDSCISRLLVILLFPEASLVISFI